MQGREPLSGKSDELETKIRQRTQASARNLTPTQCANLINGAAEEEREADTWQELRASDDRQRDLHSRFPAYFEAAEAVKHSEATSDLGRFRAWEKEQLRLARETDGFAASNAGRIRNAGGTLLAAAIAAKPFDLISGEVFFWTAALAAGLLVLGVQLLKKRRSPFWNGVFSDSKYAAFSVWHCASEAAAAALIRAREPEAEQWEDALRLVESRWDRRNRCSKLWPEEDYSGIRYTAA
ncbi:hypothetical protein ACWGQ2_07590 [Arthrobacter sp. NPDC055585]